MKFTHHLYNAFLVEEGNAIIAMDPGQNTWTMDVSDALQAVELTDPGLVIPCHCSVPSLRNRKIAVADDTAFKREVEALGLEYRIPGRGECLEVS